MALAVEDDGCRYVFRFVDTGCRVGDDGAATRYLPKRFAGFCLNRKDKAFAAAGALFHEFCVVLFVAQQHLVFINNRGDAAAMLAHERAEIALPRLLAVMIKRG